jgi:hypothetical protein
MRTMEISPFPQKVEITELAEFCRMRLSEEVVLWPNQAIPLLCYMAWPNDVARREEMELILRNWAQGSKAKLPRFPVILREWARVADIFHHYHDLVDGEHQKARGGPSIGKAIELVEANSKSKGTGHAKLWEIWGKYKDVAHLVTAAVLVCVDVRHKLRAGLLGETSIKEVSQTPLHIAMLMPDLVLAVALGFEQKISNHLEGSEPKLNPETVWHIPNAINVAPVPPPTRKIRGEDVTILNARRAGNRGVANRKDMSPTAA